LKTPTARKFRGHPALSFFRRVAQQGWDTNHFTFISKYPALRKWLASQIVRPSTILTIGCGTGELERAFEKLGHTVVSLDLSFPMLRAAAQRYRLKSLVHADAHVLPFTSASFDLVLLPESLGYLEAEVALREAARILKKQGRVMMTTYPPHLSAHAVYKKRSLDTITSLLPHAGLVVAQHRFLTIRRLAIGETSTEEECDLLYVAAKREKKKSIKPSPAKGET
jgi:ubiquinone/menaquinone biosynthesis C-methylase UbiE